MIFKKLSVALAALLCAAGLGAQDFRINASGYFNKDGVDVMAFNDFYPEGHQGGISVLMNGHRVASNGDIRFDATPGQWQPVPKQLNRKVEGEKIITTLCFPDSSRHFTGFNPMIYPDYRVTYTVTLEPQGKGFLVTVDLDKPVPENLLGRAGFNIEFFPGDLFGKPWIMDKKQGIYPQQPNSPVIEQESYVYRSVGDFKPERALAADIDHLIDKGYSPYTADAVIAEPYAVGKVFTSRPDDPYSRLTIKSLNSADLKLYDGRMNHTNGWFVLRSEIPAGATKGAVQWYIEPNVVPGWTYPAVVQTSQVGYMPNQSKVAIIETDRRDAPLVGATLVRYDADGEHFVKNYPATPWEGEFLRYNYLKVDFSDIQEEGLYAVKYGDSKSPIFRIAPDVYDRGVWQPVIEYFLPYQMCHMRVADKYKVWHNYCHMDDAQMAPLGNHIDGYSLASNPTSIKAHEPVPGVNIGGWHDAGDDDVRPTTPPASEQRAAASRRRGRPPATLPLPSATSSPWLMRISIRRSTLPPSTRRITLSRSTSLTARTTSSSRSSMVCSMSSPATTPSAATSPVVSSPTPSVSMPPSAILPMPPTVSSATRMTAGSIPTAATVSALQPRLLLPPAHSAA